MSDTPKPRRWLNQRRPTVWEISCFEMHWHDHFEKVHVIAASKSEAMSEFRKRHGANWKVLSVRDTGETPPNAERDPMRRSRSRARRPSRDVQVIIRDGGRSSKPRGGFKARGPRRSGRGARPMARVTRKSLFARDPSRDQGRVYYLVQYRTLFRESGGDTHDFKRFWDKAQALKFRNRIVRNGGEATLHERKITGTIRRQRRAADSYLRKRGYNPGSPFIDSVEVERVNSRERRRASRWKKRLDYEATGRDPGKPGTKAQKRAAWRQVERAYGRRDPSAADLKHLSGKALLKLLRQATKTGNEALAEAIGKELDKRADRYGFSRRV